MRKQYNEYIKNRQYRLSLKMKVRSMKTSASTTGIVRAGWGLIRNKNKKINCTTDITINTDLIAYTVPSKGDGKPANDIPV